MTQLIAALFLVLFAAAMVFVGVKSAKKTLTMDGFLLGGRNIGPWISAFAYGTSYFSAVILIGYAGKTGWQVGIGGIWIGVGNALVGCLLGWLLLAGRTRSMTHSLGAATMPEFFEKRYLSKAMKIYSAVIIFVFLVPYCATVYKGLGYLFSQIFPIFGDNANVACMFIIALLTAIYLVLGGYVATAVTDFVQGIIMIFGVIIMVVSIANNPVSGGFAEGFAKIRELGTADGVDSLSIFGGSQMKFLLMNTLLTSIGALGLPQMIHKFYAISDKKQISKAAIVSTFFALIIGVGAYMAGTFGRLYLGNKLPENNYDLVVPTMLMKAFSHTVFGNIVLSIILLLVLSASMSTLSSLALTSSSAIAVDLVGAAKPDFDKLKQMRLMRTLCFVFVALSFVFATFKFAFIMQLMSFSWGVVAGCFIGPYIWGLYGKGITRAGAWCGILSGVAVVGAMTVFYTMTAGFGVALTNIQNAGVAAMVVSLIVTPLVSLFTKKYDSEHISRVFSEV